GMVFAKLLSIVRRDWCVRALGGRMETRDETVTRFNRRDWLKATFGGGTGLALGGLLDVPAVEAASRELKLANVSEFTTSCNFCSCGCGMIASVRDGKLLKMEGDYD